MADLSQKPTHTQAQRDLLTYGELFPGDNLAAFRTSRTGDPKQFDAALRVCVRDQQNVRGFLQLADDCGFVVGVESEGMVPIRMRAKTIG